MPFLRLPLRREWVTEETLRTCITMMIRYAVMTDIEMVAC
jgi:hypothetical protein